MDITIQRLLTDLNTVSKIGIGDKIGIHNDYIDIQREGIMQSIGRTISGDSRDRSTSYLFNTLNTSIAIITLLLESEYIKDISHTKYMNRYQTLYSLLSSLNRSKNGISNMLITYHNDGNLITELKDMIGRLDTFIQSSLCELHMNISDL